MLLRFVLPEDRDTISEVLTEAFKGDAEARLVSTLRNSGDMALELVAIVDRKIVGYVGFARHYQPRGWYSLSPVAVRPRYQRRGIGAELIRYGLDYARQARTPAVTVLGDLAYYRRFGFTHKAAENLSTPYPSEHTGLYPIAPGTAGTKAELVYADAFSRF
ncbi:GNAT family N-acetyltransferase [Pseudooceanicola sp. 502str34]